MIESVGLSLMGPGPQKPDDRARLKAAAEGFEALFLQQMLKSARAASLGEGLLDNSGRDKVQAMLDDELAKVGAGRSGFGLAAAIERQFGAHAGPGQDNG